MKKVLIDGISYVPSEQVTIPCTVSRVLQHADGNLIGETLKKRDNEDFIFKNLMIYWAPIDDGLSFNNLTGTEIFKSVNNGRHPLLFAKMEELMGEEMDESAIENIPVDITTVTVQLSAPYYALSSSVDDKGKRTYKKRIDPETKEPVTFDFFNIRRFPGEKGSFEGDIRRKIEQISKEQAHGGGFVKVKASSPEPDEFEIEE